MNKNNLIEKEEIHIDFPEESLSFLKASLEIVKKPGSPVAITFNKEEWLSYSEVISLDRHQDGWFFTLSDGKRFKSVIPDAKFDNLNKDIQYLFLCPLNSKGIESPLLVPMTDKRMKLNLTKLK